MTIKELEEQLKEYLKIKEQYGRLPAAETLHAESESSVTSSFQMSSGSVSNFEVNCETQEQDCYITKGWKLSDTAKSIYKNIKTWQGRQKHLQIQCAKLRMIYIRKVVAQGKKPQLRNSLQAHRCSVKVRQNNFDNIL